MPEHNKKSHKVGTNMFGKGQRIISDKYRRGWKQTFGYENDPYGCKKCDKKVCICDEVVANMVDKDLR